MRKNAIITGANRGIGYEMLKVFTKAGYDVWACARRKNKEFETKIDSIAKETGALITPVYFDLNEEQQIKEGIKSILKEKKKI